MDSTAMSLSASEPGRAQAVTTGLRPNRLGVAAIVFFVVAAVGPMSSMMGASALVFGAVGPGAPAVFILMSGIYLLFVVGYTRMSRYVTNAGGFVTYIARSLGNRVGAASAAISVLMYTTLLCSFFGIFAVLAQGVFAEVFHLQVSWQVCMFVTLALVGVLAYTGVDVSLRTLSVLLVLEIIALGVVGIAIVIHGGGVSGNSVAGFAPSHWLHSGLGAAMLWAAGVFVGIEATVVFSEEAKDRHRTVPRAAYVAIAILAVFYVFITWALSNAWGLDMIANVAMTDPNTFIFTKSTENVSALWTTFLQIQVITSFFAVLLGLQNILSRYFFSLGRAGLMPKAIGRANAKNQTPANASLAITIVLAAVLAVFTVFKADPYKIIYQWLIGVGTVSLLLVLSLTCLAVIVFFGRIHREGAHPFATFIAPGLAAIAFLAIAYLAISHYDEFVGGQSGAAWLLVLIPIVAVIGLGIARFRKTPVDFSSHIVD